MDTQTKNALWMAGAGLLGGMVAGALLSGRTGYDFRQKRVLITGGSRGLGLLLAREFARRGAWVAICARDMHELQSARQDLEARHAPCVLTVPCDVTDRREIEEMIDSVEERFGRIDVLVNNAGIIQVGPVEEMTLEDYQEAMDVHFWAPLYATLAVLPSMRRRQEGRIVNITSIGGKVAIPHLIPYDASKFALVGLSEGLHAELKKHGIIVTTIVPGLMRTGSQMQAQFKGRHKEEFAWFSSGGSLPITSMNAERAAREIVDAVAQGKAEVTLSIQAKMLEKAGQLFPGMTSEILGLVNRALPEAGGIGQRRKKGMESRPEQMPEALTTLSDQAAERNNEMQNQMWI